MPYKLRIILLNNKIYCLILCLLAILFCMRIFNLEADLPYFGMSLYQPFDEGSYSRMALNLLHYGSFDSVEGYHISTGDTFKSLFVSNILQIVSFALFGNNYYGSRMPFIFCAGLTLILLCLVIRKFAKEYKVQLWAVRGVILITLLTVIASFPYLMMSRVVESSNIRALGTILFILTICYLSRRPKLKYFLIGLLAIVLIFFVYFSNLTPLFAACSLLAYYLIRRSGQESKQLVIYGGLGIVVGLLVSELYYLFVWDQEAIATLVSGTFGSFGERAVGVSSSSDGLALTVFKGAISFFDSNMFFYDLPFLIATVVSFCFNAVLAWRRRDEKLIVVLLLILGMLLQAAFTNDYIERKAIVVYPACVVSVAVFVLTYQKEWSRAVGGWKTRTKVCLSVLIVLFAILVLYSTLRFRDSKSYLLDFSDTGLSVVVVASIVEIGLLAIALFFFSIHRRDGRKKGLGWLRKCGLISCVFAFGCALVVNGVFSFRYYYSYNSYTEKTAMIEIGQLLGDSYVTDPYAYSVSLYNGIRPISSASIESIRELFMREDINYLVDYSAGGVLVKDIDPEGKQTKILATYDRNFTQMGRTKTIAVYEKIEQTQGSSYDYTNEEAQ